MLAPLPTPNDEQFAADQLADEEAIAEFEAKGGISHEAIVTWVRSWGSKDELPPPQIGD